MDNSKKKKLLIYAHYYIPDVASSGQMQAELAEGMLDVFDITVITTVPSYEGKIDEKYKQEPLYSEDINGVHLIRLRVPEFDKKSKLSRIKNLLSYYRGSRKATKKISNEHFDYVFSDSQPPLLGGILGLYGKKVIQSQNGGSPKVIYNIQDYNPEQIKAIKYFKNNFILNVLMAIDKNSCRKSDLIIVPGRDLVNTMKNRFIREELPKTIVINNWGNEKLLFPLQQDDNDVMAFKEKYGIKGKFVFMYSGNIGLYYDLENLIKVIGKFKDEQTPDGRSVVFAFVGAGSMLENIRSYVEENHLKNVVFIPYQLKNKLVYSLNAGDVHFCVNAKGIKGVSCPSKYYGLVAVGKPILGILEKGTEMQMLIDETKGGIVCEPGDYKSVENNIHWFIEHASSKELIDMGRRGHDNFLRNLSMNVCIQKFSEEINKL